MRWFPGVGLIAALATPLFGQNVPLSARTKGSPTAPIVVYEMSDFQCPFCRRHAVEVFPALEQEYIRTGKVRWVFVNYPLTSIHPNAARCSRSPWPRPAGGRRSRLKMRRKRSDRQPGRTSWDSL